MKVHGQPAFALEHFYKLRRDLRATQTGHVFDRQNMSARFFRFDSFAFVVVKIIERPLGVSGVGRITNADFSDFALRAHRIYRQLHGLELVKAIENAKDINALAGGKFNELFDNVAGVVGVTHRV